MSAAASPAASPVGSASLRHRLRRTVSAAQGRASALPEVLPAGTVLLDAAAVAVDQGGHRVLTDADLVVRAGEVVALVGPNGAGKSSLLAALSGDLPLAEGEVTVGGRPLGACDALDVARRRAVLPQHAAVSFGFTVADVVRMGRAPWARTPAAADDDPAVASAMALAEVDHLANRSVLTLSGGERARVALARVLAQRTQLLLLDEPTAALDVHHQELVLDVVTSQAASGCGVVVVVHDLSMAAAMADRVVVLAAGRVAASGTPEQVMDSTLLSSVWHHDLEVVAHPRTGELLVLPCRPLSHCHGGPRS
ncbi:MAG: heme ABC transporter ATP-binding protein [Acidimicrobiia bacterium]|nr:heme ABC transporter ATP-binding protein [Acidimicrobiia bacterium]